MFNVWPAVYQLFFLLFLSFAKLLEISKIAFLKIKHSQHLNSTQDFTLIEFW